MFSGRMRFEDDCERPALCVLADGCLASSARNGIKIWNPAHGKEIALIRFYEPHIGALCSLPDGRFVSGHDCGTIRF
jgi:hypothetical protein